MPIAKEHRSSPRLRLLVVAQIFLLVGALSAPLTSLAADPNGHIVVNKQTDPDGSPQSFHFTTTGAGYAAFNLTDGGTNDQALPPGTYTVEEDQVDDWDSSMSCHNQVSSPVSPNFIVLAAGNTITCDVVNTHRGHIIVHKSTRPSGSSQSFDFTTTADDYSYYPFSLSDGQTDDQLLLPGSYSVSEDPAAGWTTTYECVDQDDDAVDPSAITLIAGGTVECTFTNTDSNAGSITIAKAAVGGDATFHFTSADVPEAPFDVTTTAGSGATSAVFVNPGSYHVTESDLAGWAFTSLVCSDDSSTAGATATIDVSSGESVTCTWTNSTTATFTVHKTYVGTGAGPVSIGLSCLSGTVANSPQDADDPTPDAVFTVNGFTSDPTCSATETVPAGYVGSGTPAGTCSALLSVGTCTITNDQIPTVTINQAPGQADTTNNPAIHFTVQFSETVTDFDDLTDVSLTGSAASTITSITPLGGDAYDVLVTATTSGTVAATVPAGVAVDSALSPNVASTSTDNSVTYDGTAPDTSIVTNPTNPSIVPNASFTFTSTETPATFECRLDAPTPASPWTACSSPQPYTGLAQGSHTFEVRATDAADNTDQTPATWTWTITPATVQCGICLLEPTQTGLELKGNGAVTVTNGGVHVNSTDPVQAVKVGGHPKLTAVYIGGPAAPAGFQQTGSGTYSPAPVTLAPISDPLASLVQCSNAAGNPCASLTAKADVSVKQNAVLTIQPGIYNAIQVAGNAKLTMAAGIYVIKGSLKVDSNASIIGNGVTLYLACSNYPSPCAAGSQGGVVDLNGGGLMTLSAPISGDFAKITIFADRNNISTSKVGGSGSGFGGTIYLKSGRLQLTANDQTLNCRIVVDTAIISGNGTLTINVPN